MADELVLWGVGTGRTIRPHWAMFELGLQYQVQPIGPRTGETKSKEYTQLNPRQKLPLLQDDDFTIGESAAIISYLAHTYGSSQKSLIPEDRNQYAQWLDWCFFIVSELDSTSLYVMRRHGVDTGGLGHVYGHAPEVVEKAAEYFREQVEFVNDVLADGRPFLMGDQFTTADILLTTCLTWAVDYKVGISKVAEPYLERTLSREAYIKAMRANSPKTYA